eukprot:TRINITY_DN196_c0_g1_i2.p1 TRINITY_DN196_c0_g1~~TRINITY_DN196_c0_g1_i2.p1  ORF type:complete len:737 (+),score=151.78 TRINITY_DN196_c0_g1_i2:143-2353(+)
MAVLPSVLRAILCVAAGAMLMLFISGSSSSILENLPPAFVNALHLWNGRVENPIREAAVGKVEKGSPRLASVAVHPLDPLTFAEFETVRQVLLDAGVMEEGKNMVHGVGLVEPPKATVLAWAKGNALPARQAFANIWKDSKIHMVLVDLASKSVVKDEVYEGTGKPLITATDAEMATIACINYPPFQAALKERGIPLERVNCPPLTGGWYNQKLDEGRRLLRVTCFDMKSLNFYMQPIEGITMFVDIDKQEVYRFTDQGPVPNGAPEMNVYTTKEMEEAALLEPPMKPISIEQPEGVNFKVDGYEVSWAKWNFHARPDPRNGLIISQVTFNDTMTKTVREVLYQGALSEMFVPYQDPTENWFYRTFMDVGEYDFGLMTMPLVPLNDCPRNAHFIDGVMPGADGAPYVTPNMVCVFERYSGDVVWRHTEPFLPGSLDGDAPREVRPKVNLVVRQAATVGNYDYTIDWEFQMDGLIRVSVTMSGMVTVRSISASTLKEVPQNGESLHGSFVNDHTIAVNHDHFINFRLDMDVDGAQNSFVEAKLVTKRLPEGSSWRKSVWDVEKFTPLTELKGQFNVSGQQPAEYMVVNPHSTTRLGNPRAYKIMPHTTGAPLMTEDDFPQKRAAWTKNNIWVTPYSPSELYAGGAFPNQQHGEDTLDTWTKQDRSIEDTDLVVWYNVVYHHHPVQEDFPVMPSTLGGFEIKPANFFELNPVIHMRAFSEANLPVCHAAPSKKGPLFS